MVLYSGRSSAALLSAVVWRLSYYHIWLQIHQAHMLTENVAPKKSTQYDGRLRTRLLGSHQSASRCSLIALVLHSRNWRSVKSNFQIFLYPSLPTIYENHTKPFRRSPPFVLNVPVRAVKRKLSRRTTSGRRVKSTRLFFSFPNRGKLTSRRTYTQVERAVMSSLAAECDGLWP